VRPPGRRGGGGRGPKIRRAGGRKSGGKHSGCIALVAVGSALMLGSGLSLIALRLVQG